MILYYILILYKNQYLIKANLYIYFLNKIDTLYIIYKN